MSEPQWQFDRRATNARLVLCAIGIHKWDFICKDRYSVTRDMKVCHTCEARVPVALSNEKEKG